jgi:hypothetical protein
VTQIQRGQELEMSLSHLQIDFVELVEQLPIKQIPSGDVVVGGQLFPHQARVNFVHQDEDAL